MYGLFTLIGLGQSLDNGAVTFVGLMAFTVAAALTTYYMAETRA